MSQELCRDKTLLLFSTKGIRNVKVSITHNKMIYSVADHFSIVVYLGLLTPVTDGLSTYVQEPLMIGRRGRTGRDLNEKKLVADNGR